MIVKNVALWIGSAGSRVAIPVSQFDTIWRFVFSLINGSSIWPVPSSADVVLNGRKPDNTVFSILGSVENGKAVVNTDIQMTAVAGQTVCELSVLSGGNVVGTANFVLDVEASPKSPDDITSETTLPAYGEILDRIADMEGGGGGGSVTVDDALSGTSENPVQNKIIKVALDEKVDKIPGKGLSTENYTSAEKIKLASVETGAQKNPDLSGYALSANVHNIPAGGTTGQFLVKSSGTDYDAAWVTVPNANGVSF